MLYNTLAGSEHSLYEFFADHGRLTGAYRLQTATSPFETFVALLLLAWFVVSVLNQFNPKWLAPIRARDYLGALAQWRLFDRNSGQWDYHLLYREKGAEGHLSAWVAIPIKEVRAAHHCLWNPEKRTLKVLTDLASSLVGSAPQQQNEVLKSIPYLLLLNVVIHHEVTRTTMERQFMIVRTLGGHPTRRPEILFRSAFHVMSDDARRMD